MNNRIFKKKKDVLCTKVTCVGFSMNIHIKWWREKILSTFKNFPLLCLCLEIRRAVWKK